MNLSCAQFSRTGTRESNQDALGYTISDDYACFVVSDGVSGEPGSEIAARCAVERIMERAQRSDAGHEPTLAQTLRACIEDAHGAIRASQQREHERGRMSATVIVLLIDRQRDIAQWAHLGDSRLYRFARGALIERTRDHSVRQQLLDAGLPSDGVNPGWLHMALGMRGTIAPAISEPHALEDGDVFLLCTDGLWQTVAEEALEDRLRIVHSVDDWALLIEHEAMRHSDSASNADNYSALAVWAGSPQNVTLQRPRTTRREG
ncbi:PP2C family protein-serine/threonine phosphatase [Paraburkholderia sacchari]|uniref:PP2C family protein-serine/threonine phosphatase n=1 Tax=Paraburkholderia sacchari TaxID=159450 RepID=UPI001BD08AD2|nr:PP2C family serine/threonine-protein phosphatase [Paraburkholderia sacchari]